MDTRPINFYDATNNNKFLVVNYYNFNPMMISIPKCLIIYSIQSTNPRNKVRFLLSQVPSVSMCFVFREANLVVHRLACFALLLHKVFEWHEVPPHIVQDTLIEDLM